MSRILALGFAAFCMGACSPAQGEVRPAIEGKVADLATTMNSATPMQMGGGLTLQAVAADGRTLVLEISGIENWRPNVSDETAGKLLGTAICDRPSAKQLIAEGAEFRVDATTPSGEKLAPLPICRV